MSSKGEDANVITASETVLMLHKTDRRQKLKTGKTSFNLLLKSYKCIQF